MPEPALTQGVIYLTSQLCQCISISLFSSIWQTCLLTLAVALILQLVPKVPAWARFVIWAAALVVSVSLPIVAVFAAPHSDSWSTTAIQLDPRWSFLLAGVWAAFSFVRAILLLRSAFRLHAVWRRAIPVDDAAIRSFISSHNSGRSAVLCTSEDVSQPSVIGFFAPRILIPAAIYRSLPLDDLRQIVLHEMEHLRRRDDWINLIQKIGLVFFPLNPALLWIERRLCKERELACDDHVIQSTRAPKSYASCLVHLAEQRILNSRASLALGAWERRSELASRVHHILERRVETLNRRQATACISLLLLGLLGGAGTLAHSPQLVSFAAPLPLASASPAPAAGFQRVPGYQEAVFRSSEGRPALIQSVAHMPSKQLITKQHKPKPVVHASVPVRHEVAQQHTGKQLMLLTSWQIESQAEPAREMQHAPQVTFTVLDGAQVFTYYEATPTTDVWLIVQL